MQTNATTANIVGVRALFWPQQQPFLSQAFPLFISRLTFFSPNNSLYLTRPRSKSFPGEDQSAVPPRGLTIFWCYSRFSIFCLNVSCFLKLFAQLSLIRHVYNNPERKKRATTVCIVFEKKNYKARTQTFSRGQHCWGSCKRAQHCCATLRRSQNNRNVGTCWANSLTVFKLYAKCANKCQHCCGSRQTDATSHHIVGPNIVMCCWPTMLRPFAWAIL